MKNQEQMFNILTSGNPILYSKFATAQARLGIEGEKIDTIIKGEIETTNTVKEPSAVMKGPLGEEYIISLEKFNKLYEGGQLNKDFNTFKAKGKVYGIEYAGESIEFEASWGEKMILNSGDMLVTPNKDISGDVYRIEKEAFSKTYKKDESLNFTKKLESSLNQGNEIHKKQIVNSKLKI